MLFSPHCIVVGALCFDYMTKNLKGKMHITLKRKKFCNFCLPALTKTFLMHSQIFLLVYVSIYSSTLLPQFTIIIISSFSLTNELTP